MSSSRSPSPRSDGGALDALVARLVAQLAPDAIVLFGSRARGTAHARSDVDLLVVGSFRGEAASHLRRARALVAGHIPRVDVVLASADDVARTPFLRSLLETGRVLWRRP